MFTREKIFIAYERPEASDPSDRVVLLREGFSFWALIFGLFWLIYQRYWAVALFFCAALAIIIMLADYCKFSTEMLMLAQAWLSVMLAYYARDVQGWWLRRKGYRLAGVLAAESSMNAHRRYFEFAR